MKTKCLSISLFFLCLVGVTKAQFSKAVGGALLLGVSKKYTSSFDGSNPEITVYGVSGFFRYQVARNITVGVPVTLGLQGSANSREGGSYSIGLDLPVTVDYNFGLGSNIEEETDEAEGFGGFVGGGAGYTYSNSATNSIFGADYSSGSSYGPLVNAGIRAALRGKIYTLRLSYKIGLEKAQFKTFGAGIYIGF